MKKIKNSDFIIQLPDEVAGKELSTGDYVTLKLYTVNSTNYTEFSYEGGVCPEEQKVDAYRMSTMESGVVQMLVESHIVDVSMPDGYFDLALNQTTDYYWIKTQEESAQEQINELRERIAEEEQVREAADDALEETISELSENLDTNYYDKTYVDNALANKQDALTFDAAPTENSTNPVTSGGAYTALSRKADSRDVIELSTELSRKQDALTFDNAPTQNSTNPVTSGGVYDALQNVEPDLSNYYTKSEVDDAISDSVEDNKVLYVQFTEVAQGSTELTCSHTVAEIYEAYSEGRVVVGQFQLIDMSLIGCKEDSYVFNGMFSNRTVYIVGSKNIYVSPQEEHIGYQFIDLQVQVDSTPTSGSNNAVSSGGVYSSLDSKSDKSTTYTKTEVDTALTSKQNTLTFDNAPTQNSTNPVTSGGVYDALQNVQPDLSNYYTKTEVDTELSTKADTSTTYTKTEVDTALANKQNTLTFDNAPTQNSTNPVTSGGVYSSLGSKADASTTYTKTEVDNALSDKVDTSTLEETELVVSAALNDLNERKLDASDYTPVNLNNYYTKTEIDAMIGDINTALNNINGNS